MHIKENQTEYKCTCKVHNPPSATMYIIFRTSTTWCCIWLFGEIKLRSHIQFIFGWWNKVSHQYQPIWCTLNIEIWHVKLTTELWNILTDFGSCDEKGDSDAVDMNMFIGIGKMCKNTPLHRFWNITRHFVNWRVNLIPVCINN
jgi:hypothetical protein